MAFVGRGDMSRGGLLLRHASNGVELDYAPIAGAVLHGKRPPKLPPLRKVNGRIAGLQEGKGGLQEGKGQKEGLQEGLRG